MNSFKLRRHRQLKRHEKQEWKKQTYKEIDENLERPRESREAIPKQTRN